MVDVPTSKTGSADLREFFDDYVTHVFPKRRADAHADWEWPGDEWVDDQVREETYKRIIGDQDVADLTKVVEIGPGAGKYTNLILDRTAAEVSAYELSGAFIDVLNQRFKEQVANGRLRPRRISWTDNEGLIRDYGERNSADLFFAIDVLYFMDFQSAFVYLISAAYMLKKGGRFSAIFADGTSESGWARMIRDAGRHSAFDSAPCTRFHWLDMTLLNFVLPKLGFGQIAIERGPEGGLDIARLYVSATLIDPLPAHRLATALRPAGDSTNVALVPVENHLP